MEQNIRVGAGAIVIKDGKTLLAKRKGSHASGSWGSFGGHVDFGEHPTEAVKREAMEELGIEIGNFKFMTCMSFVKDGKQYLDVSFVAELLSGEPKICEPDKIEEIGWYALNDLPNPLFEPVRIVLEAIKTGQQYFEGAGNE